MTPIIFLDMDGVLATQRAESAFGRNRRLWRHLDPVAVKLVEKLCDKAGAKIVLSSTWRHTFDREAMDFILSNAGFGEVPWHDDWRTPPARKFSGIRGHEIAEWLETNGTPDRYLILDDDGDMLGVQLPHLVQTHSNDGMSTQNYVNACAILGVSPTASEAKS